MIAFAYAALSGALSKALDEKLFGRFNLLLAAVSAFVFGSLLSFNPQAASVFLGIAVGNFLAGKVDSREHHLVLWGGLMVGLARGFQLPFLMPFAVAGFFALLDEHLHASLAKEKSKALQALGQYRLALPCSLLFLSLALNDFSYLAYGVLFDASYWAVGFMIVRVPRKAPRLA